VLDAYKDMLAKKLKLDRQQVGRLVGSKWTRWFLDTFHDQLEGVLSVEVYQEDRGRMVDEFIAENGAGMGATATEAPEVGGEV
jgi:hypothetical protein